MTAKFENHWHWGYEHIQLFELNLGSAAGTILEQIIYCSLLQFPHLHSGIIIYAAIIAHSIGIRIK